MILFIIMYVLFVIFINFFLFMSSKDFDNFDYISPVTLYINVLMIVVGVVIIIKSYYWIRL